MIAICIILYTYPPMVFVYALFLLLPEDGVAAFKFFNSVCKSILLSREFQMSFGFIFTSPSRPLSIVVYYSIFFLWNLFIRYGNIGFWCWQWWCGVLLLVVVFLGVLWFAQCMHKLVEINTTISVHIHLFDHVFNCNEGT